MSDFILFITFHMSWTSLFQTFDITVSFQTGIAVAIDTVRAQAIGSVNSVDSECYAFVGFPVQTAEVCLATAKRGILLSTSDVTITKDDGSYLIPFEDCYKVLIFHQITE